MNLSEIQKIFIRKTLKEQSGQILSADQDYLIQSRLSSLEKRLNFDSVGDLMDQAMHGKDSTLVEAMIEEFTVNETRFFRDTSMFEMMSSHLFPSLVASKQSQRRLKIWSAASSSGQEAYSVAMTILETCPEVRTWDVQIMATDLSKEMNKRVSDGIYNDFEVQRGLNSKQKTKYFQKVPNGWQACDDLRKMVKSQHYNLVHPNFPIGQCDCVLLRNVLIYFTDEVKVKILNDVAQALTPDGVMLLGAGESLSRFSVPFHSELIGGHYVYRKNA